MLGLPAPYRTPGQYCLTYRPYLFSKVLVPQESLSYAYLYIFKLSYYPFLLVLVHYRSLSIFYLILKILSVSYLFLRILSL